MNSFPKTAIAKKDVKVLMELGGFSDFRKGNTYRCMVRENEMVLIDENHMGFSCKKTEFEENFELV